MLATGKIKTKKIIFVWIKYSQLNLLPVQVWFIAAFEKKVGSEFILKRLGSTTLFCVSVKIGISNHFCFLSRSISSSSTCFARQVRLSGSCWTTRRWRCSPQRFIPSPPTILDRNTLARTMSTRSQCHMEISENEQCLHLIRIVLSLFISWGQESTSREYIWRD